MLAIAIVIFVNIVFSKKHLSGNIPPQQQTASNCITPSQAINDEGNGQSECVQFAVGSTYVSSAGNAYLDENSDSSNYGFIVWMPSSDSFGSSATSQYANQQVDVTGNITQYDGAPEIQVTDPSQITLAN